MNTENTNTAAAREARMKKQFETIKEETKPEVPYFAHTVKAFVIGGLICVIGQLLKDVYMYFSLSEEAAGTLSTVSLIFVTALLTGIGIFDKIGRFAGAGTYVPISGFANSIVSCAIEFKTEGPVAGIGSNMFKVAGPVLVYGILSSWIAGIIYYIIR